MQANAQITNLTIQRRLANAHRLARGERVRDVICKKMVVFLVVELSHIHQF